MADTARGRSEIGAGEADYIADAETVVGSSGADVMYGGETMIGGPGDDLLEGAPGASILIGSTGNDLLNGDGGGLPGDDRLDCGAGLDEYVPDPLDLIRGNCETAVTAPELGFVFAGAPWPRP